MPVIKKFNIYEVSGGKKVTIVSIKPKEKKELTKEEIAELSCEIMEMFYDTDKVKLFDEEGNGTVIRGVGTKTFVIETVLE